MTKDNKKVENKEAKSEAKAKKALSMFEVMKMIDSNTKKVERFSIKIDRLNNLNAELKAKLKTMIENI